MLTPTEQALLFFADLRRQLRGSAEARAIIDRRLGLLARAGAADAEALAQLDEEIEDLRRDLLRRFGPARPLKAH